MTSRLKWEKKASESLFPNVNGLVFIVALEQKIQDFLKYVKTFYFFNKIKAQKFYHFFII